MKVRLTPDSLRFRLDQTDTETLSTTGAVEFALSLGAGSEIRCVLRVDEQARSLEATFSNGEIVVTLPVEEAETWLTTDQVGLENRIGVNGRQVQVLVEKDLGCHHGEGGGDSSEAEADTFDHLRD